MPIDLHTLDLFALELVTLFLVAIVWRLIGALDKALERQQSVATPPGIPPVAVPAEPPAPQKPPTPVASTVPVVKADDTPVIDEALVNFVKKQEGFSAKAYGDYKQYSIGYGTRANSPDEVITEAEAEQRLRVELSAAEKSVESFIPKAPKGVKQAMTDATYNLGPGWQKDPLGALLLNGDYENAKSHLMQYVHAGGKVLEALVSRRTAECNMFDNPL